MTELSKRQVANMTDGQIVTFLRQAALFERENKSITWERGTNLVNIVAVHGDKLADAMLAAMEGKDD